MKVCKLFVLFLFMMLGGELSLLAQNRVISGKVFDAEQQPMMGVTVQLEGTSRGTVTSEDGSFTLEVPSGEAVLNVSFVGYVTQNVKISPNQMNVTIYMVEDSVLLEEMVVVGYGTQKRVNLIGSVSVVGGEELENRVAHSVTHMLQGAVPGLNVTTSSGRPGSTPAINVRGITSINGASPLVLIDGAEGDLNRINPDDVESISVIKDAAAAAVYGARAAFGVILVTTKSGSAIPGKTQVRYSGRFGWEESTTSTDYENRGYWSVYTVNKFWYADSGTLYFNYTDQDMQQLLARVNDKTEHPDRPWVVEDVRDGRKQWVYYGNYDWWDMMYRSTRPVQRHSVSFNGGSKDVKYFVSGAYDKQEGILKQHSDIFEKYNLRSKIDFNINKWGKLSNNSSFYSSKYTSLGDGSVDNTIAYSARHALANIPMKNPDGSWVYGTPYCQYKVANGRHIILGENSHRLVDIVTDFSNTSRLTITPMKELSVTADFTYRLYQTRNVSRSNPLPYREYPDAEMAYYNTGAGDNRLDEKVNTRNYFSTNIFATYNETFNSVHKLEGVVGFNYETLKLKNLSAWGRNLISAELDDLNLVGQDEEGNVLTGVGGGQNEYALAGYFGRINYDYKGRYLLELSGRYDGSSRFASGQRWGWFPSGAVGWRISEEPFFEPAREYVDNLKLRVSLGSLGNQNVSSYYAYLRLISIENLSNYTFGEGSTPSKYATIGAPVASDLTWETANQWNLGLDITMLNNRLNFVGNVYVRDTKDMLTEGVALPAVYGASPPKMNAADLRTKGYEISINWKDRLELDGKPLEYGLGFNLSDYRSKITRYANPEKSFAKDYYVGMRIGEIWGFVTDGLFQSREEAQAYAQEVDLSYINNRITGGWQGGDLKFVDLDGNKILGIGSNTVDDPGDRKILGNSLPSLSYGFTANVRWQGIDLSVFFQGTGNHYMYPSGHMMSFWGCYSYPYLSFMPKNFLDKVWAEDNPDAYFTRPMAYSATSGPMSKVNDRYLQNLRYLRLKNLTVGYTLPKTLTQKIQLDKARVYFSGENLCFWSPIKKNSDYVDPEAVIERSSNVYHNAYYPWGKTFMFGIDLTF